MYFLPHVDVYCGQRFWKETRENVSEKTMFFIVLNGNQWNIYYPLICHIHTNEQQ